MDVVFTNIDRGLLRHPLTILRADAISAQVSAAVVFYCCARWIATCSMAFPVSISFQRPFFGKTLGAVGAFWWVGVDAIASAT